MDVPSNRPRPVTTPNSEVLYQFPVTKLRSWRTGYVRVLTIYTDHFATYDPTTTTTTTTNTTTQDVDLQSHMKETNSWSYSQLMEYMAVPNENDTILLQVQNPKDGTTDQLKFSCPTHHQHTTTVGATTTSTLIAVRSILLTVLIRQQHVSGQAMNINRYPLFSNVTRMNGASTSSSLSQSVTLQVLPYGIIEHHQNHTGSSGSGSTMSSIQQQQPPQTYYYIDMMAISLPSNHETGIFLHFREPNLVRCYTIPQNHHRTTFVQRIQEHCANLGICHLVPRTTTTTSVPPSPQYGLPMLPSMTIETWMSQQLNFNVGPTLLSWNVTKDDDTHTRADGVRSSQPCQLAMTGNGYIVETDLTMEQQQQQQQGSRRIRRLGDIYCIALDRNNASRFTLEYHDCTTVVSYTVVSSRSSRSSSSSTTRLRDAVIVSIYDAARVHHPNHHTTMIHISDLPSSFRYCLSLPPHPSYGIHNSTRGTSMSTDELSTTTAKMATLFQSTPVPQHTLKRLYSIATYVYSLISGDFALPQQSVAHQKEHQNFVVNLYQQTECSRTLIDACCEFNCSVQQPHIDFLNPTSTVEKHIIGTIGSLFGIVAKLLQNIHAPTTSNITTVAPTTMPMLQPLPDAQRRVRTEQMAGTMFQTLSRLAQTPTGYKNSAELTTLRECLPNLRTIEDTYCIYSAYSVLNVLLSGNTMKKQRDMETEYVNKNVILKCGGATMIDGLVVSLLPAGGNDDHAVSSSATVPHHVPSDLILMVTSDILQSLLCSYHDTTSPEHFQLFIGALANRYRALLSLLRSSTPFVLENTALLLHLLSTHAPSSTAAIRDAALSSAVLLQHFYLATFSPLEGQRFLSRYLCSMWLSGPPNCDEKRLLKRMVPHGFLAFLNMPPLSRMEEDQLDVLERDIIEGNVTDLGAAAAATEALAASTNPDAAFLVRYTQDSTMVAAGGTNTARLRSRMALASNTSVHMGQTIPKENFRIFFHVLTQDHSMADLIWNQQTRRELRIALESELEYIRRETEARGIHAIAWNHQQFHVKFPSLDNEVKVGDVYMRLWLQAGDGFIRSWDEPVRLFEHLFRRFLCEVDRDEKVSFFVTVGKRK